MSMQAGWEALTQEAGEWDTTSEALGTAKGEAEGLYLSPDNFSFITFVSGVAESYESARSHVVDILAAGKAETKELADALRDVRNDFQSTDEARRDAVAALWELE